MQPTPESVEMVDLSPSQQAKKEKVEKITKECMDKMLSSTGDSSFDGVFKQYLLEMSNDAIEEDISGLMATMGFIAALFMSFVFGRSGHDFPPNSHSLWGDGAAQDFARDLFTMMCGICTCAAFCAAVVSSRIYMDLKLVPNDLTKAAVANMGSKVVVTMVFVSFFIITNTALICVELYLTIMLPKVMGVISVVITTIFAFFALWSFIHCDNSCFDMVRDLKNAVVSKEKK